MIQNQNNRNNLNSQSNRNNLKDTKHILFYSNFCQFSNEVYKKIEKMNIKDRFILINISQRKYKIPSIITTVPTILLDDKKTLIVEDNLDKFLEKLYNTLNKDIDPFTNMKSISNDYSFLDDDSNSQIRGNFGSINDDFRIETPPEDSSGGNSGSITDRMNNMQQNRNSDIQKYFKK
jgi:hypothetical protein